MSRNDRVLLLVSVAVFGLTAPALAQQTPAYRDPKLPAAQRAVDLVSRMTVDEKAGQLRHAAPAISRLSVPAYNWWNEGLHGVARAGEATVFPQAIGLAATFDTDLMHQVADVISTEFRAKYVEKVAPDGSTAQYRGLTVWSPNINIFRDPRWGRGQETYGEDPHLTAEMGVAFVKGLQGPDPVHLKTMATAKHFAVHSGPEADRHHEDVHPSKRDLEDTYLPAFKTLVQRGGVEAVMCAYNALYGVPACANSALLNDRLRLDWGFKGHVVTDCGAVADVYLPNAHAYRKTKPEAFAATLKGGSDLGCDFGGPNGVEAPAIAEAIRTGLVTEAEVDVALRRLFEVRFRLGLMDPPTSGPWGKITAAENDTPAHRAVALRAAQSSLVLLKNDGLLPLKTAPKTIAVIGPNADSIDALVGNYNGTPSKPVTLLSGVRARFPDTKVIHVAGTGLIGPASTPAPDAIFCQDAGCATKGLKVEEFGNLDLAGAPVETRTDSNAKFRWGWPTRKNRQSSIRWSGFVTPQQTGPHGFTLTGDGGWRIKVDGRVLADFWDGTIDPSMGKSIDLTVGQTYAITIEARQDGERGTQGLIWSQPADDSASALAAAKGADLVIFAGGLSARVEGEEMRVHAQGFAGGDRTSLDLPAPQQKLLEDLHGLGKPVILVLMNGSAIATNWADKTLPAIVEAWYPGGEGGTAIAGLLAGDYSPSGRLPVTVYRSVDQLPPFKDYNMAGRTYRYFGGEALYPFGYGLSYTRFTYGKPVLKAAVAAGQAVKVSVPVTNSGGRDGDEVVQLYVTRPGVVGAPIRTLKAFKRLSLKKGQTQTVSFDLPPEAFATVDPEGQRVIEAGVADLWIGGGQPLARSGLIKPAGAAARLRITNRKALAD
ncbi:glycoside hydrolase family 3 C-terminal domain-containing protein [Caulobacter sp. SL161]|uniref:glycoside hydrolase family 3 C-terminal domain-containing protein n=1 Tax=Caulobacter sp. SL161 TaxID=2995156 RepID=UPI002272408A|nr:glycoside hydrolase family 3 C-terminal domain-containing protein [Caulobacter sp. SL161]MCY1646627.1 glycoside hydrolase family 3 C-terminal domain-containing protein [Caulobacter sp. SL161]